jgi:S-adenosylmethionine-diacylgycerolhomoserine-N-methlytransferase
MSDAVASVLMDRMYRHQRHIYDLTRKYYLPGRDRLIAGLSPPPGGRVLEIGCGTARNLVVAARTWPLARFYGIDVSREMLATARRRVRHSGLTGRIAVAHADATRFDPALLFGVPAFSRIIFSYSLSIIPDWRAALDQALRWVAPAGELHIVDFGGQERLGPLLRGGLRRWLHQFHVNPRDALEAELRNREGGSLLCFERPYGGYAQYAVFRRAAAHDTPDTEALATP